MVGIGISWRWALIAPIFSAALFLYLPELRQQALNLLGLTPTHKFTYQPLFETAQDMIVGRLVDDGTFLEPLEGFLGIPYALPPVGDLRFRPAVPAPPSNQTIEAFYLGPRSIFPNTTKRTNFNTFADVQESSSSLSRAMNGSTPTTKTNPASQSQSTVPRTTPPRNPSQ